MDTLRHSLRFPTETRPSTALSLESTSDAPTAITDCPPHCPRLVLDSRSGVYRRNAAELRPFLAALKRLPIPVSAVDLLPETEVYCELGPDPNPAAAAGVARPSSSSSFFSKSKRGGIKSVSALTRSTIGNALSNLGDGDKEDASSSPSCPVALGGAVRLLAPSKVGSGVDELRNHNVRTSLAQSLERTGVPKLEYLVAQRMDRSVTLMELTAGMSALIHEQLIQSWGVIQFPLIIMALVLKYCAAKNYAKPGVYQGEFNLLSRPDVALLSLLKSNNVSFQAYDPTAGGFLAGDALTATDTTSLSVNPLENLRSRSPSIAQSIQGSTHSHKSISSFSGSLGSFRRPEKSGYDELQSRKSTITAVPVPRIRYLQYQSTIAMVQEEASCHGITLVSAALRWLAFHSGLDEHDAIVLDATDWADLTMRVGEIAKGPLPQGLAVVMNNALSL